MSAAEILDRWYEPAISNTISIPFVSNHLASLRQAIRPKRDALATEPLKDALVAWFGITKLKSNERSPQVIEAGFTDDHMACRSDRGGWSSCMTGERTPSVTTLKLVTGCIICRGRDSSPN